MQLNLRYSVEFCSYLCVIRSKNAKNENNCEFLRTKADAEVDFLSDYKGTLFPIEVKSADNTKAKSLHLFCSRYSPKLAFKTSLKNVGDNRDGETKVWSLPLYVLFRLREYVGELDFNWSS